MTSILEKLPSKSLDLDWLANELLSQIEVDESRLLNWGFTNVRSDLHSVLPQLLERLTPTARERWRRAALDGVEPGQLISNLVDRKLLMESRGAYRSRFAETIRLLLLLRQRFSFEDWQTAPRLVSDLRLQLQRRRYPRRDIEPDDLLDTLQQDKVGHATQALVGALLRDPDGSPLHLARFQKDAISLQLQNLRQRSDRGLVIGAGTGSGKTKAFYIPTLAEIGATLTPQRWVRALAIYPRVELLKDQLAEALLEIGKLDPVLAKLGRRTVVAGAYFGDTPRSAEVFLKNPGWYPGWTRRAGSNEWICPYVFCSNSKCRNRDMVWSEVDMRAEAEANTRGEYGRYARLRCPVCQWEVSSEHLALTRSQMVASPPDVLFTTTETLNGQLSNAGEHALFGVGTPTPPRLLLLDEIHTYEGITGAQVAYLLRRWRHMRGYSASGNLCIVGLSATLTQAEAFFSKLTGLPLYYVGYLTPRDDDYVEEGMEYNVVLKGDPVSGTSLLSTSVQTAMLVGRVLDPPPQHGVSTVSHGAIGQKTFAFTDKLDVTNRWYHTEEDAETINRLAQYRKHKIDGLTPLAREARMRTGQDWHLCESIGHKLDEALRLGVTSSQNRGVRQEADLIIATSTLEVGFNDLTVGAVLQHKAPHSLASFLQRKGRAGRTRQMRPWMVVVTSAYGRDRWAFQHSETLFNPTLPPIQLPLDNYYVRKIQAAYALMDWLCVVTKNKAQIDVGELLSSDRGPKVFGHAWRRELAQALESILSGARLEEFSRFVQRALGLPSEDQAALDAVLWGDPRSIILEVIPTLLRQVESNWQVVIEGVAYQWEDNVAKYPMPDFVPPNLFSDLNLPELALHIPDFKRFSKQGAPYGQAALSVASGEEQSASLPQQTGAPIRKTERMPLLQGMREFTPGHVSKRFSRKDQLHEAHWLALPDDAQLSRATLPLQYLSIAKDDVPALVNVDDTEYAVYRPRAYTLSMVPRDVMPTSSARLLWRSHFAPKASLSSVDALGDEIRLRNESIWGRYFTSIHAYTQANSSWVDATRLANRVRVETRKYNRKEKRVEEVRRTLRIEENGQPAALGFTVSVDAIEFKFAPLDAYSLVNDQRWPPMYRHLGPEYFRYKLHNDVRIAEADLSSFHTDWLWQLELSMLVATAIAKGCTIEEAARTVAQNRTSIAKRTMQVIFQTLPSAESETEEPAAKLQERLLTLLENEAVVQAIVDAATVLGRPDPEGITKWLSDCYASSLASALFTSVVQLVPDINEDDLIVDVEGSSIWISEGVAGGVGLVSRIASAIAQNPRDFDLQMHDTVMHCDRQQLALQLATIAGIIDQDEPTLAEAFAAVRSAADLPRLDVTRRNLSWTLDALGISPSRELIVALNAKFLRPNSGPDSDALMATLARHWHAEEARIGISIDLRVMAVAAAKIPELESAIRSLLQRIGGPEAKVDEAQIFNLLQSLLWLNCHDSCPDCIARTQPFQELVTPSRALLAALLGPKEAPIAYGTPTWLDELYRGIASNYWAQLTCEQDELARCKRSLLEVMTTHVDVGFQHFYPTVERVSRLGQRWLIDLTIRELLHT